MSITKLTSALAATILLFIPSLAFAPTPHPHPPRTATFPLLVTGPDAKSHIATLGTYAVSFFEETPWIGPISLLPAAEPLLLSGTSHLAFLSARARNPNSYQNLYVVPNATAPVAFSVPHAFPPNGMVANGFAFDGQGGALQVAGENRFVACPGAEAHEGSYQIWWDGEAEAEGRGCLVRVLLVKGS